MIFTVEINGEDSGTVRINGDKEEDRLTVEAEPSTGGWAVTFPLYRYEAQQFIETLSELAGQP